MSVFLTIISGVFVYILGQFVHKLIIEPWQKQKECVANIAYHLIFYANVYSSPGVGKEERNEEASIEARKLAAELTATTYHIPAYSLFARIKIFPKESDIMNARNQLIGLSNCTKSGNPENNYERENKIKKLLRIKAENQFG